MGVIISLGYFRPRSPCWQYLIRKAIHFFTGIAIFFLTYRLSRETLLLLFVAGTIFSWITYFIRRFNYIHVTSATSLGTLFYPLGILSSFLVLYDQSLSFFRVALLFLAVSDTMANVGGYLIRGNYRFAIFTEEKSLAGILGFAVTAFLILHFLLPEAFAAGIPYMLVIVAAGIHFEIFSYRGSDNLTVPLGTALILLVTTGRDLPYLSILGTMAVLAPAVYLLLRYHILSSYGAVTAYLLGVFLFIFLGPGWGITVIFFFVTSVLLTMLNSRVNRKTSGAGNRNSWQVLANIAAALLASVLFLVTRNELFIQLFIVGVAAVTADTWASETGPVFHRSCFSLATLSRERSGVSGGISAAGILGALSGALSVSAIGAVLLLQEFNLRMVLLMALSGFAASFVDSLLGARLEPRLENLHYFKREKSGERITPNDVINTLASLSGLLIYLVFRAGWH